MLLHIRPFALVLVLTALVIPLQAAAISRQSAEEFSQKMALIQRQGEAATAQNVGARRTRLTEDELNSWFMYRAQPVLPAGVSQPRIPTAGEGRPREKRPTDLTPSPSRGRQGPAALDPLSRTGARVP